MMAYGSWTLDAHDANPLFSFPHIKSGAFSCEIGELAQYRLDHIVPVERGLIAGAQPTGCPPQPPCPIAAPGQATIHGKCSCHTHSPTPMLSAAARPAARPRGHAPPP